MNKLTIPNRIKELRRSLGVTQEQLGRLAGISKQAISAWERGASTPQRDALLALQRVRKVNPDWIVTGRGAMFLTDAMEVMKPELEEGPPIHGAVPLISWVQAGKLEEVVDLYHPGEGEAAIYTTKKVGKRAFALRIKGDSMENPAGRPTYPVGSIIIVDPDQQADNGSRVVVRVDDADEATFKQLVIDGGKRYLKPLNPRYPIIEIDSNATICGVVVQTIIDE